MDWGHAQWTIVPARLESTGQVPGLPIYKHANRVTIRAPSPTSTHPSNPLSITTSLITPNHPLTRRSWDAGRALSAWEWEVVAGRRKSLGLPDIIPSLFVYLETASPQQTTKLQRFFSGPSGTGGPVSLSHKQGHCHHG